MMGGNPLEAGPSAGAPREAAERGIPGGAAGTAARRVRTFSTGHGGGLFDRYRQLLRQYRHNLRFSMMDWTTFEASRAALAKHTACPFEDARVLDLGCGQRFPVALLFHTFGARVTGIDTDVVDPHFSASMWVRMLRVNGAERFVKSVVRHVVYDREYYRELERLAGRALRYQGLDLRFMDARQMTFPDAHFDLIHSNAVFEHVMDVPRVLEEVARVLKPTGIAVLSVHLFPSLSGGHNLEWAFPDEFPGDRVPPWDHLREARFGSNAYLNRWRAGDFIAAFEKRFSILECVAVTEGERFLTPELEREMSAYSREDLLKREIRVVLRPSARR